MNLQPNNWGLTPQAKNAPQNTNQGAKGSDPNWLGGAGGQCGCKPIPIRLAEHDGLQGKQDIAWRAVA
jgi:hypothetical protein